GGDYFGVCDLCAVGGGSKLSARSRENICMRGGHCGTVGGFDCAGVGDADNRAGSRVRGFYGGVVVAGGVGFTLFTGAQKSSGWNDKSAGAFFLFGGGVGAAAGLRDFDPALADRAYRQRAETARGAGGRAAAQTGMKSHSWRFPQYCPAY